MSVLASRRPRRTALLRSRLAGVRGLDARPDRPLAPLTTFRIGGPAELLVEVERESALRSLLAAVREIEVPFQLLGLGSNILLPDAGLPGVVARLKGHFRRVRVWGERASAGGAVPLGQFARRMAARGLRGLEALSGFPSTVGGAVYMNAGSYGTEIKDVLLRATVLDVAGDRRRLGVGELAPAYRRTSLQGTGAIVTRASFQLRQGDPAAALAEIEGLHRRRWVALPAGVPNAGSTFRNPPGDHAGRLIEACGLKGRRAGGAEISARHANVIVNAGGARAEDVLDLMLTARAEVGRKFGVWLEPELVLAGELADRWRAAV